MPLNRKNRITVKKSKMIPWTKIARSLIQVDPLPTGGPIYWIGPLELTAGIKNNSDDGCTCRNCGQYNEFAEPNQADGTFLCFACKNGY
jgi:hypothetical protein